MDHNRNVFFLFCSEALPFFLLLIDLSKACALAKFALSSNSQVLPLTFCLEKILISKKWNEQIVQVSWHHMSETCLCCSLGWSEGQYLSWNGHSGAYVHSGCPCGVSGDWCWHHVRWGVCLRPVCKILAGCGSLGATWNKMQYRDFGALLKYFVTTKNTVLEVPSNRTHWPLPQQMVVD